MKQTHVHTPQQGAQTLAIILRKFVCKNSQLNQKMISVRINPTVEGDQTNKPIISQSRKVKKGCATFYGESMFISGFISTLNFQLLLISPTESMKTVGNFTPCLDEIRECYKKRGTFNLVCDFGQLFWEGHNPQCLTYTQLGQEQEDCFLQDFNEIETKQQTGLRFLLETRKIYSPNARAESRMRRLLGQMKRESSRSDLISESPHKKTVDTLPTVTHIKRRKVFASPNKNLPSHIFKTEESDHSSKQEKKIIQQQLQIKNIRSNTFDQIPLRLSTPKQNLPRKEFQRKKNSVFDKISVKPLVWATIVGFIGGMTATQF